MHTVMCDITAAVLSELSALAKTLQTLPNIDSPLSVEAQSQGTNKNNRMSVPSGGGGATSGVSSLASKRMTITGFGSSTVSERTRNKGKGRVQIVVAELYLLAGRVPDAMKEWVGLGARSRLATVLTGGPCRFIEGAEVAKTYNDHLWHGKALECIGVCMVILAYLKHNFQVVPLLKHRRELHGEGCIRTRQSSPRSRTFHTPIPKQNRSLLRQIRSQARRLQQALRMASKTLLHPSKFWTYFPSSSIPS